MADEQFDPGAAFRDMVTQWERNFDAYANQVMGTEAYAQAMNQFQQSQLAAQKAFTEFMKQQLVSMNIPTRDDIIRLGETLRNVDMRLERIERKLNESSKPGKQKRKGPPRTKKPPAKAADSVKEAK